MQGQKIIVKNEPITPSPQKGKLSTFGGVYTPSILTILGVIMYLRFGWVVGQAGLGGTILIVLLSTSITFLTALSIAAIATDQEVKAGGAYYMISRSLGIKSGGAIGIPLYLAQTLSIALYVVGFAESLTAVFPLLNGKAVALITTVLVTALAWRSAGAAVKVQYFILTAIGLSLLSFFLGDSLAPAPVDAVTAPDRVPFWRVFAVFFPAVTGIMAGVNLSGDLKNPRRAIPRGTFWAVGTGLLLYLLLPLFLSQRAAPAALISDPLIMRKMALWGDAILLGVWGATLSSALGSVLGAPRILQALARDGVLPGWLRWLGKGAGAQDTPRYGTLFTLAIALLAVMLGNLNVIAPVLTMFFLTTYGVINLSAGTEKLLKSPSFRPTFKVHWGFSALGAFACLLVMLLINPLATAAATVVVLGIYFWLESRGLKTSYGDVRKGIWMALIRAGLLRTTHHKEAKTWRPQPLVLSGAPTKRWHLINLARTLTHARGLMTVAMVMPEKGTSPERLRQSEQNIEQFMRRRKVAGLVRCIAAEDPFTGSEMLVSAYGMGAMVPNTVILGANENEKTLPRYLQMIDHIYQRKRHILVMHTREEGSTFGRQAQIDVWWGGLKGNGGLMMVLAHLTRTHPEWWGAQVTIKMVVKPGAVEGARQNLKQLVEKTRTHCAIEVLESTGPINEVIPEESRAADLVYMGLKRPDQDYVSYYQKQQQMLEKMPTTVLCLAADEVAFDFILMPDA